jgi:hypothetical protein
MLGLYAGFAIAYLTLYFCGYSLKVLLLEGELKKYDLYLTPWLGMGLVVIVLMTLSWAGFSVRETAGYFIIGVAAANAAVWARYREAPEADKREAMLIAAAGFVVCSLYGSVFFASGFKYFSVSVLADFASYLNDIRAALVSSARHVNGGPFGSPHIAVIRQALNSDLRGCVFVHAFLSALYGVDAARISYMVSAFAMFLGVTMFRPFLRERPRVAPMLAILCCAAFNTFYQGMVFWAYTGQLFSFGISLAAFRVALDISEKDSFAPRPAILFAFLMVFNGFNYIEALAYPAVPAFAYGLAVLARRAPNAGAYWKNMSFAAAVVAITGLPVIIEFFRVFYALQHILPGFKRYIVTFLDVAGLGDFFNGASDNVRFGALIIVNFAAVAALAKMIHDEGKSSFISVAFFANLALYVTFAFVYDPFAGPTSYNIYKAGLSLSFVAVIIASRGVLRLASREARGIWASLALAAFALLLPLGVISTWRKVSALYTAFPGAVSSEYDILRAYAENPYLADANFIINTDYAMSQLMTEYYLPFGRTFATSRGGDDGDSMRNVAGARFMLGDMHVSLAKAEGPHNTTRAGSALYSRGIFSVSRLDERNPVFQFDISGVSQKLYNADKDGGEVTLRHVMSNRVVYSYASLIPATIDFSATFWDRGPEKVPLAVNMSVNGVAAGRFEKKNGVITAAKRETRFEQGVNEIAFEFEGSASNDVSVIGVSIR